MGNSTVFMGMSVKGSYGGWSRAIQQPIEELYPHFKLAFEKGIKAVMWEQYTPGWNDGEPCEFSVREPKLTANEEVAKAWLADEEPDMEAAYPGKDVYYDAYDYESYSSHPDGDWVTKVDVPVDSAAFEDALRSVFGNDTKVIVTPEAVVQFDYDCGY